MVPKNFKTIKASSLERNRCGTGVLAPVRLVGRREQARNSVPGSFNPIKTYFSSRRGTHPRVYTPDTKEQIESREQRFIGQGGAPIRQQEQAGTEPRTSVKERQAGNFLTSAHPRSIGSIFRCSASVPSNQRTEVIQFSARVGTKSEPVPTLRTRSACTPRTTESPLPERSLSQEHVPKNNYQYRLGYITGCGTQQKIWLFIASYRRVRTKQCLVLAVFLGP